MTKHKATVCDKMDRSQVHVVVRARSLQPHEHGHKQARLQVDKEKACVSVQGTGMPTTYPLACVLICRLTKHNFPLYAEHIQHLRYLGQGKDHLSRTFFFDAVLPAEATQVDVFNAARVPEMVTGCLNGFHATLFAYGQTGSGKTFCIEGFKYKQVAKVSRSDGWRLEPQAVFNETDPENLGIVPRAVNLLFRSIARQQDRRRVRVGVSYVQIYREQVYDLLNPALAREGVRASNPSEQVAGPGLRMRWSHNQQFYLENMYKCECSTAAEVLELYQKGVHNKVMASHRLNAQSSRSHCLFILHIDSAPVEAPEELTSSKVTLVDLAGSERGASANPKHGALQKEAISINKSLFALRKVIMSLAEGMSLPHVPFRDSKLTCLLKHSLGGTSLTTMLACITPSDEFTEDTLSTLEYSSRAKAITNTLVVNEDPKNRLIRELRQQVAFLQDQLATVEMPIPATPGGIAWDAAEETHAAPAPPHGEHDGYGKGRSSGQAQQTDHAETTESEEALNHAASSCRLAERLLDHGEFQSSPCRPSERIGLASGVDHGEQQAEVIPQVEAMGRYLVQSTVMLKRLSTAYSSLRREYAELSERSRGAKQLNDTLMAENTDLRGKVSMYEDVVAGPLSSASGGSPIHTAGSAVLVELAELRRENELLRAWSQQGAAAAQHGNAAAAHCGHGGAAPRRCASTRAARGPGGAAGAPMANGTMSLRQLEAMLEACGGGRDRARWTARARRRSGRWRSPRLHEGGVGRRRPRGLATPSRHPAAPACG
uniref:Kinesin-like protein n=1 Tax=Tetraselmis sp. GSL018 TaxID=582737 RepID=A0A061SPL9_9CHLO